MTEQVTPFPVWRRSLSYEQEAEMAERILETPVAERVEKAGQLRLEDSRVLLGVVHVLMKRWETSPAAVRDEAEFFYRFVEKPKRRIGFFDERDYLLGEFALIAGTMCRGLSRRDEARFWFDRSESRFQHVMGHETHLARLSYQRMALLIEEQEFEAVLEQLPKVTESFTQLNMPKEAMRCRFLEAVTLKEIERLQDAVKVFLEIAREAQELGSERLVAGAYANLLQLYAMLGEREKALAAANEAVPILERLGSRIGVAKIQWGAACLLREEGQLAAAIEAYRAAQREFAELKMRADVAAIHLVVADLLLDVGQQRQAEWEILTALPIIEEYKLVPEGMQALALLRDSVKRREIDRKALRELHGYFQERVAA